MKLVDKIKSLFKGEPSPKIEDYFVNPTTDRRKKKRVDGVCIETCGSNYFCDGCGLIENCSWIQKLPGFDRTKPSILIIDDNYGMVSFLRDDLEQIFIDHKMDLMEYNILEFSSKFAAYQFIATHQHYDGLNITKAIIDITYGGSVQSNTGNIRLTGVDVFRTIYKTNPEVKFLFYTGNQLNPYIKSNRELMEEFKDIYHDKITDFVLYKTSLNIEDRQRLIANKLFDLVS